MQRRGHRQTHHPPPLPGDITGPLHTGERGQREGDGLAEGHGKGASGDPASTWRGRARRGLRGQHRGGPTQLQCHLD